MAKKINMMRSFVNQYKLFFICLWVIPYFIYPSWALPVGETSRHIIVSGLLMYFAISLFYLNRWLYALNVNKPFIIQPESWLNIIKNHSGLAVICLIAAILHAYPIVTRPILIIGDEALHLHGGLWIYNFIDSSLHKYFQLVFWILMGLIVLLGTRENVRNYIIKRLSEYISSSRSTSFFIIIIFSIAVVYYYFLQNGQFNLDMRYTPLSRLLYFVSYMSFGINPIVPRFIELAFYLLTAVYIYRIIILFSNENTALLGASIYLFLPVTFIYASLAELACSTVFFIVLISFHHLRFIQKKDDRDLILTSFFIGVGFLYKQPVFLMFFICTAYLIYCRMKERNFNFSKYLKIMLMSLVPVVPWMIIQRFFAWRHYRIILTNLIPPDGMGYSHFKHLPIETTWVIFILFILSIFFVLWRKRNNLILFFLLIFIAYYLFLALDQLSVSPRMLMAFCPTIAIFSALFVSSIINKARWKYSFNFVLIILISYLILNNTVPSLNAAFLGQPEFKKMQDYPSEKAMKWVKNNVRNGEKIVTLRIMTSLFYRDKYEIDRNKIIDFWYEIDEVSTPEKLKQFCIANEATYIMFPYGAVYDGYFPILKYLYENMNNEFVKVTEYNIGGNYIFIYKFDENSNRMREDLIGQ
jgi:hypothetical protein